MVQGRGSFFWAILQPVRIAALGGTAFLLAMLSSPAQADWSVKRNSNQALINQMAASLRVRPDDRELANRLARLAPKAALEQMLSDLDRRAAGSDASTSAVLAYAQLLLAARQNQAAAAVFARAAATAAQTAAATVAPGAPGHDTSWALAIHEGWARALHAAGDRAGAVAAVRRALEIEQRPARRPRLLRLLLASTGEPAEVDAELAARRELLALQPNDQLATLALVDALERAGQPREAAQVLEDRMSTLAPAGRSGKIGPKIGLLLRMASLYEGAGALDRAAAILDQIARGLPPADDKRRREVWARTIDIARRRGRLIDLQKQLEDPALLRGAAEWQSLSEVRDELGDLEGALDAARRAQALLPRKLELGRRVAALLDRLGRESDVTSELVALARLAPGDPRFTIELIERQFRTGRKDDARAELDRAIAKFASNPGALGQLADLAARWSENRRALDAWARLLRLSPRDEMAILGLGEVQFQGHKKDLAIRTWQALREGRASRAEGSARLAEVLMEHDLLDEATAETLQAQSLEPNEPRHRRLMAQILERQRRPEAAIAAWENVLAMNAGPNRVAERREARSRILGILSREGRARLDERVVRLRAQISLDPADRETALFLAEAELRSDATAGAIETLRATMVRDRLTPPAGRPVASDDAKADVILTLVRLLRQTRQLDEAVRLLAELAQRIPSRAREAHIQIADIELGRYEDRQALDHASSAARLAPDDGRALIRIAEVQERAGEVDAALVNYRRALSRDANPSAAFALARLLTRRGSPAEAAEILRGVLRSASDEETITETGRRAIDLEEYLGSLEDLERVVSGLLFSNPNGAAYRRLLVEIYRRLLPALYRAPVDMANASENRAHIAQHGLRPLLELLTDADGNPERTLIELLGMLGNRDAAPALARLAQGAMNATTESMLRSSAGGANETQLAAVIALGRLGDGRARSTIDSLLASSDVATRVAAVWALGRMATAETGEALTANINSHLDVAGFAYLGLGRTGDPRWAPELIRASLDPSLPTKIRRAAAIGLGLSRNRAGLPALLTLLESGDEDLERAAATGLGALGEVDAFPALLQRALARRGTEGGGDTPALAAIDRLASGAPLEDEAKAIDGTRLDLEAMLSLLESPPARADRTAVWTVRTPVIERILAGSLSADRSRQVVALEALDARDQGLGLGHLAPEGNAPLPPAAALALGRIGGSLRARVAGLLGDGSPEVRALALRVSAKLGDPGLRPSTIVAALGTAPLRVKDAAGFALGSWLVARPEGAGEALKALEPLVADAGSWERRLTGVELLGPLGAYGRSLLEQAAVRDASPLVRSAAVTRLGAIAAIAATTTGAGANASAGAGARAGAGAGGSLAPLVAAAGDPVPAVRAAAARALARRRTPGTEAVLSRLRRDPSELVRGSLDHIEP
jgi:tetratricopeptide (TPR) repeat protein